MIISPYTKRPVVAQNTRPMTLDKLKRFMEFETLLRECGWILTCPRCTTIYGPGKDGVQGNNDAAGTTYRVECGCSAHVFDAT